MIPLAVVPRHPATTITEESPTMTSDQHLYALDKRRGRTAALDAVVARPLHELLQHAAALPETGEAPGYVDGYGDAVVAITRAHIADLVDLIPAVDAAVDAAKGARA